MEKNNQSQVEQERKRLRKEKALVVLGCFALVVGAVMAVAGAVLLILNLFNNIWVFIVYGIMCVMGFLIFGFGVVYAKPVLSRFGARDNKYPKTYTQEDIKQLEDVADDNNEQQ